jgi:hypothetical protein
MLTNVSEGITASILNDRRMNQATSQNKSGGKYSLLFDPENVPPKRQRFSSELRGVMP